MGRRKIHNKDLPRGMTLERGSFYFRRRGDRKRVNLGRDRAEAFAQWARIAGGPRGLVTLADVIKRYRTDVLELKPNAKTREDNAAQLKRLEKVFGRMRPDDITAVDCYKYIDGRMTKPRTKPDGSVVPARPAPVAARHEITLLGHVLAKSIRWGAGVANVVRQLERMPKNKRTRYVTDAEVEALKALARPRIRPVIDLVVNIGQRRGDLLALRWEQVTKEGIVIRQGKTGQGVLVEITPALQATLDELKAQTPHIPREYVIRMDDGQPYSAAGFSTMWQRLMADFVSAGGVRFTFHDLRAKAASDMNSLADAQALLGHASSDTTARVYRRSLTKAKPVE